MTFTKIQPDGWNHNAHYHDYLLRAVPRPCLRALDVGCGLGGFARRLASVADHVDALDADAGVVAHARNLCADVANLQVVEENFVSWNPDTSYDFISMIASLHHLPFAQALTAAKRLLRPGGVLGVIGLYKPASLIERGATAAVAYPVSVFHRITRRTSTVGAPICDPAMTLEEIKTGAQQILPGAVIRRHLLWRYSLVWTKP